jgi:hypothetical protein
LSPKAPYFQQNYDHNFLQFLSLHPKKYLKYGILQNGRQNGCQNAKYIKEGSAMSDVTFHFSKGGKKSWREL